MTDTLPLIHPTVPGSVEGIISLSPRVIQCQECGVTDDPDTVGLPVTARKNAAFVHVLSSLHFHAAPWTTGHTDNPRLCRECRLARGCECGGCGRERVGRVR